METQLAFSSPFHGEVDRPQGETEGPAKPVIRRFAPPLRPGAAHRPTSPWNGEEKWCVRQPSVDKFKRMKRARSLRGRMTDAEIILWSRLRVRQVEGAKFRRQHPVGPFFADFAAPQIKLIIEVEGDTHGTEAERAYDARRIAYLEQRGWTVIRCFNVDVYTNLDGVLTRIGDAVHELCQRPMTDTSLRDAPFDPPSLGRRRATSPASGGRKS